MKRLMVIAAFLAASAFAVNAQSYASIFRSWGFIGDSLCSGEMECYAQGEDYVRYVDMYEYSWGQQLCRLTGSEGWNFSHGGQTAKGWLQEMDGQRGWGYAKENPKQAYIIALGVNDFYRGLGGVPGFAVEEFTADYETIIRNVQSIQPEAKIFVMTRPREDVHGNDYDSWNDIVRAMPSKFENVYVIDLYKDAPVYDEEFKAKYYLNGHLSASGYLWTALFLMDAIDKIVKDNYEDFKNVPLIGTGFKTAKW